MATPMLKTDRPPLRRMPPPGREMPGVAAPEQAPPTPTLGAPAKPAGPTTAGLRPMVHAAPTQPGVAGATVAPAPPPAAVALGGTGGYTPAAPGAGAGMGQKLEQFASAGMAAPTRFDNDLVQQGLGTIRTETDKMGQDRMRQLSEMMARRGILGSSVEADQGRRMLGDLQDVSSKRALDLGLEQARTFAGDRESAGRMGLAAGEFSRGLGRDAEDDNRFGWNAGRTTGRDTEDDRRARSTEGFREKTFGADERMRELELMLKAYGALGQ